MVKLKFVPRGFPVLLLPLWWVFLLCFYLVYLPCWLLLLLFSPYAPGRDPASFYARRAGKDKRTLRYSESEESSGGGPEKDGGKEDDLP